VCINQSQFNSHGYSLLGQNHAKAAVIAFAIAAWAHPASSNALDSLADGYLAIGDKEKARDALRRAIELVPADPAISPESRTSSLTAAKRRLEELR
jgi:Flp pilus assembly protein TadD